MKAGDQFAPGKTTEHSVAQAARPEDESVVNSPLLVTVAHRRPGTPGAHHRAIGPFR